MNSINFELTRNRSNAMITKFHIEAVQATKSENNQIIHEP